MTIAIYMKLKKTEKYTSGAPEVKYFENGYNETIGKFTNTGSGNPVRFLQDKYPDKAYTLGCTFTVPDKDKSLIDEYMKYTEGRVTSDISDAWTYVALATTPPTSGFEKIIYDIGVDGGFWEFINYQYPDPKDKGKKEKLILALVGLY
jgi:hypothetical protein